MRVTVRKDNYASLCIYRFAIQYFWVLKKYICRAKSIAYNFSHAMGNSNCGNGNICSKLMAFFFVINAERSRSRLQQITATFRKAKKQTHCEWTCAWVCTW